MPLDIVVGTQWGDEGKGRVVDLLAAQADIVARYNGGDNAGHTVTVGNRTFKLHLIPSGVIHEHTIGVIGNGVVVNPSVLIAEIAALRNAGIPLSEERLRLSYAAHVITPAHLAIDKAQEEARGQAKIGTTLRGIGPAYNDKVARQGIRFADLLDRETLGIQVMRHVEASNRILIGIYAAAPLDAQAVIEELDRQAVELAPHISDVSWFLADAIAHGKRVLAEGAQGTLLDLDHGTYPYVTSSRTVAAGALTGLGLGVGCEERVIGVTKAFQTRVGTGPFPTELFGDQATRLRGTGENPWDEFGTTTGRPRRVGWLDGVLLRYAARINGLTELVVTKLDILSGLDPLRICTAYRKSGQEYQQLLLGPNRLGDFEPVHEELPGWEQDISTARHWDDLPVQARSFLHRIETICGIPVRMASVGPARDQVVLVP